MVLAVQYTGQSARIKWGASFSDEFFITNGVKQGGVLSPILFGMYMDVLFEVLSTSQAGCRVGQQFMGAFGYADDVILIAPTKSSMNVLLDICTDFSRDFQVKFYPHKSNLIAYPKSNSDHDLSITFDGQRVYAKSHDIHLEHIIGDNVSELTITGARNEFNKKVSVLISYFNSTYIETKYNLFKVYCMEAILVLGKT